MLKAGRRRRKVKRKAKTEGLAAGSVADSAAGPNTLAPMGIENQYHSVCNAAMCYYQFQKAQGH